MFSRNVCYTRLIRISAYDRHLQRKSGVQHFGFSAEFEVAFPLVMQCDEIRKSWLGNRSAQIAGPVRRAGGGDLPVLGIAFVGAAKVLG